MSALPEFVGQAINTEALSPIQKINTITEGVREFLQPFEPILEHWFGDKFIARSMLIEQPAVATSRVHLYEHLTVILEGMAYVFDESGERIELTAGQVFKTPPGRCRAFHVPERFRMLCVWPHDLKEPTDIETFLTVETFEEYQNRLEHDHG